MANINTAATSNLTMNINDAMGFTERDFKPYEPTVKPSEATAGLKHYYQDRSKYHGDGTKKEKVNNE